MSLQVDTRAKAAPSASSQTRRLLHPARAQLAQPPGCPRAAGAACCGAQLAAVCWQGGGHEARKTGACGQGGTCGAAPGARATPCPRSASARLPQPAPPQRRRVRPVPAWPHLQALQPLACEPVCHWPGMQGPTFRMPGAPEAVPACGAPAPAAHTVWQRAVWPGTLRLGQHCNARARPGTGCMQQASRWRPRSPAAAWSWCCS